jgi:BASS family bile acid:Na+ symporter
MLVGHVLGGPDPEHAAVLALSTACRHPAIALASAATNYPGEHFGGTILLYLLVSILVGMPYIAWQRRRLAASPT